MATIVVVDDDDIILQVLGKFLRMGGHNVRTFPDAAPALQSVEFAGVDLIITDLAMPTRGEVFIQALNERGVHTPVVVLSGYIDDACESRLRSLGVSEIVQKPFELVKIYELVERLAPSV